MLTCETASSFTSEFPIDANYELIDDDIGHFITCRARFRAMRFHSQQCRLSLCEPDRAILKMRSDAIVNYILAMSSSHRPDTESFSAEQYY